MSDADLIAAFLAKNDGATVIAPDVRTTTPREMFNAVRGQTIDSQRAERAELAARAESFYKRDIGDRCVVDHAGREFWMNAEGEWL